MELLLITLIVSSVFLGLPTYCHYIHRVSTKLNQRILEGELPITTKVNSEYAYHWILTDYLPKRKVVTSTGQHELSYYLCSGTTRYRWINQDGYIIKEEDILMEKPI